MYRGHANVRSSSCPYATADFFYRVHPNFDVICLFSVRVPDTRSKGAKATRVVECHNGNSTTKNAAELCEFQNRKLQTSVVKHRFNVRSNTIKHRTLGAVVISTLTSIYKDDVSNLRRFFAAKFTRISIDTSFCVDFVPYLQSHQKPASERKMREGYFPEA